MKIMATCLFLFFGICLCGQTQPFFDGKGKYIKHGVEIYDPYLWMETDTTGRLSKWVDEEIKETTNKFEKDKKKFNDIKTALTQSYHSLHSLPKKMGSYFYHLSVDGKTISRSTYTKWTKYKERKDERLVYQLGEKDTFAIVSFKVNKKEDLLAIELSVNGSDERRIVFRDLSGKGRGKGDTLWNIKKLEDYYWLASHLYYVKRNANNYTRIYIHTIDNDQKQDSIIACSKSVLWVEKLRISEDEQYMSYIVKTEKKAVYVAYVCQFSKGEIVDTLQLKDTVDDSYSYIGAIGNKHYFKENEVIFVKENKNIAAIPLDLLKGLTLESAIICHNKIVLTWAAGALQKWIMVYDADGKLYYETLVTENPGYFHWIAEIQGSVLDSEMVYREHSFFAADDKFHIINLLEENAKTVTLEIGDGKKNEIDTIIYYSMDSTAIKMLLLYDKKNKLKAENNPTLLWGYGGFGLMNEPVFEPSIDFWLQQEDAILAIPLVRGGSGESADWAAQGQGKNKQNAINDFIAAAHYLIQEHYTNSSKLAIMGASHGGLLVGAAITQAPYLFKAAIAEKGLYDMLRFPVDSYHDNGKSKLWKEEFGNPDTIGHFFYLRTYSPYHALKPYIDYPSTFLITAEHDDRVSPLHTYKFHAGLIHPANNYRSPQDNHYLYKENGGHKGAFFPEDRLMTEVFKFAFLFQKLGIKY